MAHSALGSQELMTARQRMELARLDRLTPGDFATLTTETVAMNIRCHYNHVSDIGGADVFIVMEDAVSNEPESHHGGIQ